MLLSGLGRIIVAILLLTCHGAVVSSEQARLLLPTDFAEGYELKAGNGSVRILELNAEIIRGVDSPDYADIRLFNSEQQQLPFVIVAEKKIEQLSRQVDLPFFPLSNLTDIGGKQPLPQQMRQSFEAYYSSYIDSHGKDKEAMSYILKNAYPEEKIIRISLDWDQPMSQMIAAVRVDASDDMSSWRTIVKKSVLSYMEYQGEQLRQSNISIPAVKARYLRIQWFGNNPGVTLNKVTASFSEIQQWQRPQWLEDIRIEKLADGENSFQFDTGGFFPVTKIAFRIPQEGLYYRGVLYSRKQMGDEWQRRTAFSQYRLNQNGEVMQSPEIEIANVRDRWWKIIIDQPVGMLPAQYPLIRLAWQRQNIVFLGQGAEPYIVAYGAADIPPANFTLPADQVKQNFAESSTAEVSIGRHIILGGEDRRILKKRVDWKTYMLWLVLLVGVLLMLWIARSLMNEVKNVSD